MGPAHKTAAGGAKRQSHGKRLKKPGQINPLVAKKVDMALMRLKVSGHLTGEPSQKLSVRVDPGLMSAAAERIGVENATDIVNTALALVASPDPFVQWLLTTKDRLPEEFEIAV